MFKARRLQRYTLRELAGPTVLGLMVYSFLLLMNELFLIAQQALAKGLPLAIPLKLLVLALPPVLTLSMPMTVLLAVLIAIGRLSADQEWTAIQAAGHSPRMLLQPVLVYGLGMSLATFAIFNFLVPASQQRTRQLNAEITLAGNLASDLRPRQWEVVGNNHLIVSEIHNTPERRLERVLLIQHQNDRLSLTFADAGDIFSAADRSGALVVDLYDAIRHEFELRNVETYRIASWASLTDTLAPPAYYAQLLKPPTPTASTMPFDDLWAEYRQARNERAAEPAPDASTTDAIIVKTRAVRATIELHRRLALPFACFWFAALALPLGVTRVRSGKGAGFSISLLVIIVYWITFTFFEGQSVAQKFPAALGPWMGNLILIPWIALAYWKLRRPARDRVGIFSRLLAIAIRAGRQLRSSSSRRAPRPSELEEAPPEEALAGLSGTSSRFTRRLDRYVGGQYLRVLLLALFSAATLFLLFELKSTVEELFKRQQPISSLFTYLGYFLLQRLPVIIPLACLSGAVIVFSLLARTGELTAMKANGISLRRIALPVLVVTGAISILLFMFSDTVIPTATRKAEELSDRIHGKPPTTRGLPATGNWTFGPKGERLYYYHYYDAQSDEFHALRVLTLDPTRRFILDHRFAERARYTDGKGWELDRGWFIEFAPDGKWARHKETYAGTYAAILDSPDTFAPNTGRSLTRNKTEYGYVLTLAEISERILDLQERGYDVTSLRVAWHGKFARAVTPFVMVLLGLPFAFRIGRRGSLYGIAIAFALAIVYWAVFSGFNALGLESILEPVLAVWAPNVLFGLLGSYLLLYVPT